LIDAGATSSHFTRFGVVGFLPVRQTENGVDRCGHADKDEFLQTVMEVLNAVSREELEAVFEEWLLKFERHIQQNGEYVEEGELNKHIVVISILSDLAMLTFSMTPCPLIFASRNFQTRVDCYLFARSCHGISLILGRKLSSYVSVTVANS
jgi:hypothetical protein